MLEAEAALREASAEYDNAQAQRDMARNMALAQNGRRAAKNLPPVQIPTPDPSLYARVLAARQEYAEAKRVYEQTQ
jgi:hypothetical protein